MRDGLRILDVDRHVMEPLSMWPDYLPAAMRPYAPSLEHLSPPDEALPDRLARLGEHALLPSPKVLCVEGEPLLRGVPEPAYIETGLIAERRRSYLTAGETAAGQLSHMDATGIDVAVMLPTFAPFLVYNDAIEADRSRAYADAYNRWLGDMCNEAPDRMIGAALVSRHDPDAMVPDLEAALRVGLRAVVVRPNPVRGRTLSDPGYERFWQACEHHGLTVLLHEGTHTRVATVGADRFTSHFGQHVCSHPMEAMIGLLTLIEGGVLEAHPSLRVGILEAGCGWLPYWLWRLDHIGFEQLRGEVGDRVRIRPSEYFRRQCWIALEPGEAMLASVIREIGPANVVFGTDFPHRDHGPEIVDEVVDLRGSIGEDALREVLWDSPARLMGPAIR